MISKSGFLGKPLRREEICVTVSRKVLYPDIPFGNKVLEVGVDKPHGNPEALGAVVTVLAGPLRSDDADRAGVRAGVAFRPGRARRP